MPRPPYPDGEYPDDPDWCAAMRAYQEYDVQQEDDDEADFVILGIFSGFFDWLFK